MKIKLRSFCFSFQLWPTLLCIGTFILLIKLGVWQLDRYHHKTLLLQVAAHRHFNPQRLTKLKHPSAFTAVTLQGHFLSQFPIVLHNRFHAHQIGYDVLVPFQLKDRPDEWVLVNLGWLALSKQPIAKLSLNLSHIDHISGYLYYPPAYVFTLGPTILNSGRWPVEIQKIDTRLLSTVLKHDLRPYTIRLDPQYRFGFLRQWPINTIPPSRHLAYAIQWFIMALTLIAIFLYFCREKNGPAHEH